jgi:REP element-mobilizing transposase RayT
MPNHFHFLVEIRSDNDIVKHMNQTDTFSQIQTAKYSNEKRELLSLFLSKQFSKLFSSYTQSYNKVFERKGSLFIKNFKRKIINDENQFLHTVIYIHMNPVNHGFAEQPSQWKYSSFNRIINKGPAFVKRKSVLEYFGCKENFLYCHQ